MYYIKLNELVFLLAIFDILFLLILNIIFYKLHLSIVLLLHILSKILTFKYIFYILGTCMASHFTVNIPFIFIKFRFYMNKTYFIFTSRR